MIQINQNGLKLLNDIKTPFSMTADPVLHKSEKWWKLKVSIENKKEAVLHTATGEIRYFRQLNSVVDFINEVCPELDDFTIKVRDRVTEDKKEAAA